MHNFSKKGYEGDTTILNLRITDTLRIPEKYQKYRYTNISQHFSVVQKRGYVGDGRNRFAVAFLLELF